MKPQQILNTGLTLVFIVAVGACARQAAFEQGEGTILQRSAVRDTVVPAKALTQGLPSKAPQDIPLFTDVDPSTIHVDTTRSSNYFYAVNAPFGEVKQFFQKELPHADMHENGVVSVSFTIVENEKRKTVFVSTEKPSIYPSAVTTGTTYVDVTFNQEPLPTAAEILQ